MADIREERATAKAAKATEKAAKAESLKKAVAKGIQNRGVKGAFRGRFL